VGGSGISGGPSCAWKSARLMVTPFCLPAIWLCPVQARDHVKPPTERVSHGTARPAVIHAEAPQGMEWFQIVCKIAVDLWIEWYGPQGQATATARSHPSSTVRPRPHSSS
jgi:hypothetical protein